MITKTIIAAAAALLLTGCSSAGLFLLNSGLKVGSDHQVVKDIAFGAHDWQKLDIYIPQAPAVGKSPAKAAALDPPQNLKLPVLVFFYGGGWDSGRKEMYFFVANSFAKRGYIVVIPDYLKYPAAKFPEFMDDGAAALNWVKDNINNYGGDADNVLVAGHSAGAHLGALLLTDGQYLQKYNLAPSDIRGFAGLAGPYNFTPTSTKLIDLFGPAENFPNIKTKNFVDGDEPAMLLLHGGADKTVSARNQEVLLAALHKVGNSSQGKVYPGVSHVGILLSLTPPTKGDSDTLDDMDTFFKSVLKQGQS